ncbi:MAG: class I SAM-dependent methyltransferase [Candidatus Firestonebacteria bacterium]
MEYIDCSVCHSKTTKLLLVTKDYDWGIPGEFNIVRCDECGLVYVNPRPDKNEIQKYYPENYFYTVNKEDLYKEAIKSIIFKRRVNFLEKFGKSGKLLDVGTGDGLFLKILTDKGWDVSGVEPSITAASFAKSKLNLKIYNSGLKEANLKEKEFDFISMWEVLEHISDPNENIKEVCRLLKDDGAFIFSVPNFNSLQRLLFNKYWYGLKAPTHLYHYTSKTVRKLLSNNGFKDVKIYNSLINVKNPLPGYSDSLRYMLSDLNLYPKRQNLVRVENTITVKGKPNMRKIPAAILHFIEFIVFGTLEIISFCFGRTATLFVVAKKE